MKGAQGDAKRLLTSVCSFDGAWCEGGVKEVRKECEGGCIPSSVL